MRELLEGPARRLDHHVVDGGLEAGWRLARDVVGDLVQRVAHGELGGDLGDGKARGLGRERRAAGDARVHLDHHQLVGLGRISELDVGAARLDADRPDDGERGVAQALVLDVGEGLLRSDGDGVAGMDAHRVDVLDGADDHDVVLEVAHDLQLELLPPDDALLKQHLVCGRSVEAGAHDFVELLAGRWPLPPPVASQREARTDDQGQAQARRSSAAWASARVLTTALSGTRRSMEAMVARNSSRASARRMAS